MPVPEYSCHLDCFETGAAEAAERGDIVVIVDVLSFTTAVAAAVSRGAFIHPCRRGDEAKIETAFPGSEVAVRRAEVPDRGRFSLSPKTFLHDVSGRHIIVWSPNGGRCSLRAAGAPLVIAGALVNARAVSEYIERSRPTYDCGVTVIACCERRKWGNHEVRMADEDYLGAGAILAGLRGIKTAEARVCEAAFRSCEEEIPALIAACGSGRELIDSGFAEDVAYSCRVNSLDAVPCLRTEVYYAPPEREGQASIRG